MDKKITEKISDKTTEVFNQINSKIKNPFVFSYLISFTLLNWKPIAVFVRSDYDIYETINCIENPSYDYSFRSTFWFSLLVAGVYTVVIPFMDYFSDLAKDTTEMWKYKNTKRKIEIGRQKKDVHLKIEKFENELEVIADNRKLKLEQADLIQTIKEKDSTLTEVKTAVEQTLSHVVKLESEIKEKKLITDDLRADNKTLSHQYDASLINVELLEKDIEKKARTIEDLKNYKDFTEEEIETLDKDYKDLVDKGFYVEDFLIVAKDLLLFDKITTTQEDLIKPSLLLEKHLIMPFKYEEVNSYRLTKLGEYTWIRLKKDENFYVNINDL